MTIETQALALVNEVRALEGEAPVSRILHTTSTDIRAALIIALSRHEADKTAWQAERHAMSDDMREADSYLPPERYPHDSPLRVILHRHIIAPPVDPIVAAWSDAFPEDTGVPGMMEAFKKSLARHGGRIVFEAEQTGGGE